MALSDWPDQRRGNSTSIEEDLKGLDVFPGHPARADTIFGEGCIALNDLPGQPSGNATTCEINLYNIVQHRPKGHCNKHIRS